MIQAEFGITQPAVSQHLRVLRESGFAMLALLGLATHLSSGQPVDPQEGVAWMASAEGRQFITLSSDQWCAASVAAGTAPADAEAAAERTTAFNTGSAPPVES